MDHGVCTCGVEDGPRLGLRKDGLNIGQGGDVAGVIGDASNAVVGRVNVKDMNFAVRLNCDETIDDEEAREFAAARDSDGT